LRVGSQGLRVEGKRSVIRNLGDPDLGDPDLGRLDLGCLDSE